MCQWVLNSKFEFLEAYGRTREFFQKTPEQLRGRNLEDVLGAEGVHAWRARLNSVFDGATVSAREVVRGGSGVQEAVYALTHYPLLIEHGQVILAGGFAQEITRAAAAEQEQRRKMVEILRTREMERDRLARFLHDEVAQNLTVFGLQLDLLRMDCERIEASAIDRIGELQGMLETVMLRVREFTQELNPAPVERAGLQAALGRLAGRLRQSYPGALRLLMDNSLHVPPDGVTALFRIAREAAENAVRHSGGSLIEIHLRAGARGPVLEIRDNGSGFRLADARQCRHGLGLLLMEAFAAQGNIHLSISGESGKGTLVRAVCQWGEDGAHD